MFISQIKKVVFFSILMMTLACGSGFALIAEVCEDDGTDCTYPYSIRFPVGNITDNGDGTVDLADQGAAGGDSITVDTAAVVDPDCASTGDIAFVNTANTITANINANTIVEADLNATNSPTDNYVLSYNLAGTNFTWVEDVGGSEVNDLESVATSAGDAEIFVGTGVDAGAYITGLAACAADEKIEYVPGAPDTFTCEAIGSLVDADVSNTLTASILNITDNESTAETNAIIFSSGGDLDGGEIGLESDGDLTYTPSTGTLAATTVTGANITSGANPGHTHTTTSISGVDISADTNLAVTAPVVLTDDTLSITQNAGTDITADLEEEVTEGSLADDVILEADLKAVDAAVDEECLTYEATGGDFEWQTCGGGADTNSVKTFVWPASATLPLEAADSIPPITKDTGTNVDALVVSYDDTTDECRLVSFVVPTDVQGGSTITMGALWYSQTATSGNIIWDFRHTSGDTEGEDWDSALTTEAASADATQGTVDLLTRTEWTETLANLGWAADDTVSGLFCRDANNGSDTLVGDAEALNFYVEIPRA